MHITIDKIPPSLNKFAGRENGWEYRNAKKAWKELVHMMCLAQRPQQPYAFALVRLEYFFPDRRRRDPDNYAGKMVLDGLTAAGVIVDDDFSHINLTLHGRVDRDRPRLEIYVTEAIAP